MIFLDKHNRQIIFSVNFLNCMDMFRDSQMFYLELSEFHKCLVVYFL